MLQAGLVVDTGPQHWEEVWSRTKHKVTVGVKGAL